MEYETITEELVEEFRQKLKEFNKLNNTDPIIIKQIEEFEAETIINISLRNAINEIKNKIIEKSVMSFEEMINEKEEQ